MLLFFTWIWPKERHSPPFAHFIRRGEKLFCSTCCIFFFFFWTSGFCKVYVLEFSLCCSIVRNRFSCSKSHTQYNKIYRYFKAFITSKKSWFTDFKKKRREKNRDCTVFRPCAVNFFFPFFLNWLLLFSFFALFSVGSLDVAITRCRISTVKKNDGGWERKILFYSNFRSVCMTR